MNIDDVFGSCMKVREAISLLGYGIDYEIKGSYSGKVYCKSWVSSKKRIEKYFDEETISQPYYTTFRINGGYCGPVIGIWMSDYKMCKATGE